MFLIGLKYILLGLEYLRPFIIWTQLLFQLYVCFFLFKLIVLITLYSDWTSLHSQTTLCSVTSFYFCISCPCIWNDFLHLLHLLLSLVNINFFFTQIKCHVLYETDLSRNNHSSIPCASKVLWAPSVAPTMFYNCEVPVLIWLYYSLHPWIKNVDDNANYILSDQ